MPLHGTAWQVKRDRVLDRVQVDKIRLVLRRRAAAGGELAAGARLFEFLLAVPLRLSEALAIRQTDLRLDRQQPFLRVQRLKKKKPTTSDLTLPPDVVELLRAAPDPPFPMDKFAAIRAWHRVCDEAGVALPAGCAVHILRHTVATEVLRRTKNLRLVQELLGHSSPATTAGYTHIAFDEAAAALDGLWK